MLAGGSSRSKAVLLEHVVNPYVRKLEDERRSLETRFPALAQAKSNIRYPPEARNIVS
jgi:hypothetical protein